MLKILGSIISPRGMQPSQEFSNRSGVMSWNLGARPCLLVRRLPYILPSISTNILAPWIWVQWSIFWNTWWSKSRFGRCEVCHQLTRALSDRSRSLEQKLGDIKSYRAHLHSQYVDRCIQWGLNELSEDHQSGTLTVLVDGLDQAKFRLPRCAGLRTVSSMFPRKL